MTFFLKSVSIRAFLSPSGRFPSFPRFRPPKRLSSFLSRRALSQLSAFSPAQAPVKLLLQAGAFPSFRVFARPGTCQASSPGGRFPNFSRFRPPRRLSGFFSRRALSLLFTISPAQAPVKLLLPAGAFPTFRVFVRPGEKLPSPAGPFPLPQAILSRRARLSPTGSPPGMRPGAYLTRLALL